MKYVVTYHPDVKEDIRSIPANIKARICKAIETRLQTDPILYGQPLRQSLKGHRKVRVGDWRVIYRVDGATVIVFSIGSRKNIYDSLVFRRIR